MHLNRREAANSPIEKLVTPFRMFIQAEVSSGILLIGAALVAIIWANSPWGELYAAVWETEIAIRVGGWILTEPLYLWINDGLMAMFFFVVGLEIKRELMVGELASPRRAALPLAAALGGMVVPAVIYTVVNFGTPEVHGWGIPMATDIAFSLGILYLLGDRVPAGLRIFLASLAIADDLGAVIVIALFYTSNISYLSLVSGLGVLALVALLNFLGVRSTLVYGLFGIGGVWLAFLFSGVYPTIAGVLMVMLIPANMKLNPVDFVAKSRATVDHFEKAGHPSETVLVNQNRHAALMQLDVHTRDALTPLQRLEISLHPWVSILILPLFALANAGVVLEGDLATLITQPVTLGVIAGLVIGKQVGVSAFAWMAVRFGLASLPDGISWKHIYGVSWLAGIGFTMSLFIAGLAFVNPEHLAMAKVGVLVGSLIAGFVGFAALRAMGR